MYGIKMYRETYFKPLCSVCSAVNRILSAAKGHSNRERIWTLKFKPKWSARVEDFSGGEDSSRGLYRVVTSCSVVVGCQRFGGPFCLRGCPKRRWIP
jgi:hypothetical protein